MSEGVSKMSGASERTSKWHSSSVCIRGYSGPQCMMADDVNADF